MAKDFSSDQGGIQSSTSTEFSDRMEPNPPYTGFVEAPTVDLAEFGPGPGVGKSTRVIR